MVMSYTSSSLDAQNTWAEEPMLSSKEFVTTAIRTFTITIAMTTMNTSIIIQSSVVRACPLTNSMSPIAASLNNVTKLKPGESKGLLSESSVLIEVI